RAGPGPCARRPSHPRRRRSAALRGRGLPGIRTPCLTAYRIHRRGAETQVRHTETAVARPAVELALVLTRRDEVLLPAVRAVERLGPRGRGLAGQACSALFSSSLTSTPGPGSETINGSASAGCRPHSSLSWRAQRPSLPLPAWVQGQQPIES